MEIMSQISSYIVENILFGDGERLQSDTPLQQSGILDSTGFLEIIMFLEEQFGVQVEDDEVVPENFETLRKIAMFVENKISMKARA